MNLVRLLRVFARIGAMNELAYRANFWFQLLESALTLAGALGVVVVVMAQTDALAGWTTNELLAVVGVHFMVSGMLNCVVSPSLSAFMEDVREGTLDYTLTKPEDAQLLASISTVHIFKLADVALGAAVLVVGVVGMAGPVGPLQTVAFMIALTAGAAMVYSFWMVLATMVFWFIRIENILMVFWAVYGAGRWPITIYPGWLRWSLTVVIPVAFAVTVPAQAVTGRLDARTLGLAVVVALVSLVLSRAFWRVGLRAYSGASA